MFFTAGCSLDNHHPAVGETHEPDSLQFCISAAVRHSLNTEIEEQAKRIEREKVKAEVRRMLFERRWGVSHLKMKTSGINTCNFISPEQFSFALNTLDFAMAYLNSSQKNDKSLIESERKLRVRQDLEFKATELYLKTALAQAVIEKSEKILAEYQKYDRRLREMETARKLSPLRLLDFRKGFIRTEKNLILYRRKYEKFSQELKLLTGIDKLPDKFDNKYLNVSSVPVLPSLDILVKTALRKRPELKQFDIQADPLIKETYKVLSSIFPGIKSFYGGFKNPKGPPLKIYQEESPLDIWAWRILCISSGYSLVVLPQEIDRYCAILSEADENSLRRLALSAGVLVQTGLAYKYMLANKKLYEAADRDYQKAVAPSPNMSELEQMEHELEVNKTFIKRLICLNEYYIAYYRLLNLAGHDIKTQNKIEKSKDRGDKHSEFSKTAIEKYRKTSDQLTSGYLSM